MGGSTNIKCAIDKCKPSFNYLVAREERGRHKCQCRCLVIDLHVVSLRSLSHWKTVQLLPVKTWVIQLSSQGASPWMKGIEILTSPLVDFDSCNFSAQWNHDFIHDWPHMCILLLPAFAVAFTQWRYCTLSSWNLLRCSPRPFEGKPSRQNSVPSGLNATQLCAAEAFQKILELFPFESWCFLWWEEGRGKTQLCNWFESVICFVVPAEVIRVLESVLT